MTVATALVYLLAAVLFIVGLKFLSSPRSARRGNTVAAVGMVLAVGWTVVTLWSSFTVAGIVIAVLGVLIGAVVGTVGARQVKMTAMPQMVALFNGVGGGAAALVAVSELLKLGGARPEFQTGFPSVFAIIVGGISFAGSAIAFAKLQELMTGTPITYPGQQIVNGVLALAILALAVALLAVTGSAIVFSVM
ncbi:MAG TPA: NAD(P)(+) transhydrogenase (Re/Si-specific) subunit beta, partial [Candidatus Dormibacteraeota bacterium]|nr:NAD(P)(+) transhydrogenase (Re/Si-specific) subunit beta [Candidatus Dormibacteraeota bacterium]